jgi:hypothetical protein
MDKMINADSVIEKLDKQKTFAKQMGKNNAYCKGLRDAIKIVLAESIMQNLVNEQEEDKENV